MSALSRIKNNLENNQADILCEATVLANFNYCFLIWMFSPKAANSEINRTHKRALRVLYKNDSFLFGKCLLNEAGIAMHV